MNSEQSPDNGFINLLCELRSGLLEQELDADVKKLANLIRVRGGMGKIQLTITVKNLPEVDNGYSVFDEVKVTLPKEKRNPQLRFMDADGGLVSDMPQQEKLFPSTVDVVDKPDPLTPAGTTVSPIK